MLKLTLVTPERKFITDLDVEEVIVPGFRGELNIMPGHAPLVTTLGTGTLRYKEKGASEWVQSVVSWGYCEVSPEGVLVLAETVETKDKVDLERAERALKTSQSQLESGQLAPEEILKYQRKVRRSLERIHLAQTSD